MIPTSYQLRSFSSYYESDNSSSSPSLSSIQNYCLDIYRNIHSKGLSFSGCGVSSDNQKDRPFFSVLSVERRITSKDIFIPLQTLEPEKTPPEVITEGYHFGILSDSWIVGLNIVQVFLSPEEFNKMIEEDADVVPPFVNFYMMLALNQKMIDIKSLLIINKLLRRDSRTRYTVEDVLKSFFGYSNTVVTVPYILQLQRQNNYRYPAVKEKFDIFFNVDAFVNYILPQQQNQTDADTELLETFITEDCVVPFLSSIPDESIFVTIFGEDKLFFVKFFIFLKTCVVYFQIMTGRFHPVRNERDIKKSFAVETGIGFLERGKCSSFDLYRDVAVTLFSLIERGFF